MAISSYKSLRAFEHLFISMQVITFWNVFLFKIAIYIIRNGLWFDDIIINWGNFNHLLIN